MHPHGFDPDRLRRELVRRGWHESDLARAANISAATVTAAVHGMCVCARTLREIAVALMQTPAIPELDTQLLSPEGRACCSNYAGPIGDSRARRLGRVNTIWNQRSLKVAARHSRTLASAQLPHQLPP